LQLAEIFWRSNKFYLIRINIRMNQSHAGGNDMKSKMLIAILLGCLVWQRGALSQTDTNATDTNQSISASPVNPPVVPTPGPIVSSATSSVAALTVVFPTSITTQPASQTVISGNNATFSVTAGGTPPLGYQWFFNGSVIEGATEANYTITGVTATNEGSYTVVITNSCGNATSSVAALTVVFPPSIAAQPAGQMVVNGSNATFSVKAEGTPPLSYQWYFNGNAINGATDADYTITGVTTNNQGDYSVVITNACGSVTSSNITVDASAPTPPAAPAVAASETPAATTAAENAATSTATPPPAAPTVAASEAPAATTAAENAAASNATPPAAPTVAASETPAATSTATPPVTAVVSTNEPSSAAATSNAITAASAATPPVAAADTNASPSVTTSNATAAASGSSPQAAGPASIPLIQFQDVPITTAIENLARQAGINYLLDPKIGYGQPDASGQVKPEPTLSIRWENITAEQALVALLDNYGLQLTEDRRTHIGRITTKDPTAPPPLTTRVVQLKWSSTSNMVDSIQASLTDKRSKVLPDSRTSQLVIVATENEQEALDALINQLDKPTRQVLIETKLVQISSNPSTTKGVDWSGTLAAQHLAFGNGMIDPTKSLTAAQIPGNPETTTTTFGGNTVSTTTTPTSSASTVLNIIQGQGGMNWNTISGFTPGIGFLNADGASAVLHFLNATYDAQITSTPRIVTLDNQMATIEVSRTYPIINMAGGTQNSSGSSSVTYSNVGTILQVTPRISANDYIWMKVVPSVSDHYADVTVTVAGGGGNASSSYPVPEFDVRRIDSQVMIPNGNTLVMGGLVSDNPTASYSKVPLLGDIPGLGWAFRSESKANTKDNLIIFLTPTIIKDSDFQPVSSAAADFLKSKPPVMKNGLNPNTIWDGAEPRGDWSNPAPTPGEYDSK
jgi:type II secretory pathway component GspD/PulD (secretin)